jgi:hypothetical protein
MNVKNDPIAELEKLDRFLDGDEPGERPLDVLRARGLEIPDDDSLDDAALPAVLWNLLEGMAAIGLLVDSTDHLSDRELYRYLVQDALMEETLLPMSANSFVHYSPIGGGSEEDNEIYLRYYADDEDREQWARDFGDPLPPKTARPYDRDKILETFAGLAR